MPGSVPLPSRPSEIARLKLTQFDSSLPLSEFFQHTCRLSSEAIQVERVGVWLFIDGEKALRCANLYERTKNEHSAGTVLRPADFPVYFRSLKIRKAIPAEIAATEPWTRELAESYLRPLGISSMLDAGIFVNGKLLGVICHEHVGSPREWTTEDRDFAGSIADLAAIRIQSAAMDDLRTAFQTQEVRLAGLEKAAALEVMAAGVAHDFRNLLAVIAGHSQLIQADKANRSHVRAQAAEMTLAAERGIGLCEQLLRFAKGESKAPSVHDSAAMVGEILPLLKSAAGAKHRIETAIDPVAGQVLIDRTTFTQILMNLVVNARESMPTGAPIQLRVGPVRIDERGSHQVERYVLIEVVDQGVGIDEDVKSRIFDPFFTTKKSGTGLGLAVVRQSVDRAGGMIFLESSVGRGTRFRILLPRIGASRNGGSAVFTIPPELRQAEPGQSDS